MLQADSVTKSRVEFQAHDLSHLQHTIFRGQGAAREQYAGTQRVDLIDDCVTCEMNVAVVLQVFGLHGLFARSLAEIDLALIWRVKHADAEHLLPGVREPRKRKTSLRVFLGYVSVLHGHQLAVIVEIEKFLRGVSSVPIAERAIKIVGGADQGKVCEGLWKIPECLALRAGLFCEQPEVIGVSQHALENQAGLI